MQINRADKAELDKLIKFDKERLGDLYDLKCDIEKYAEKQIIKQMELTGSLELKNDLNKKIFIHTVLTNMFNLFKEGIDDGTD